MGLIRTVLGDISPGELGVCYAHEHVIIDSAHMTALNPEFRLDSVSRAVEELGQFYQDGGRAMIDSMPCGSRNVLKMAEISRQTQVHLVVPTGLHLPQYYPPDHWGEEEDVSGLARRFLDDIELGIDIHDYNQSEVERCEHRAGLIKVATGDALWTARESRIFEAAAQVHNRTGVPILTHTEQGKGGLQQVDKLRELRVDLGHVVLSHTDRCPELSYHRELLSTGVSLEYDSAFRWQGDSNPTLDLLLQLLPEYPDQLLLGMDAAKRKYWKAYGGSPGLSFLLTDFQRHLLQKGVQESAIAGIFIRNPARVYTFRSLSDSSSTPSSKD